MKTSIKIHVYIVMIDSDFTKYHILKATKEKPIINIVFHDIVFHKTSYFQYWMY